jgi:mannose-6-phosphate isomerase-like protein (cupin superfamily)
VRRVQGLTYDNAMRLIPAVLLSLCLGVCVSLPADAQNTTPAKPQPPKPQPATRKPASPSSATAALNVTVTDGKGTPINGVNVRATGPVDREGATQGGSIRFEGLRTGMYRLRFEHDDFVTLERDVNMPAGQRSLDQYVTLSAAEKEEPPPPPPPEPPKPAGLPPPGKAVTVSVPDFVEQNLIRNSEPQKASSMACSGLVQTVLWQVREPWDQRQHAESDAMLYVVGGEGTMRMNERDIPLAAGRFVSVPRGTTYGLTRRGRNPLIVLANLAGEACAP